MALLHEWITSKVNISKPDEFRVFHEIIRVAALLD